MAPSSPYNKMLVWDGTTWVEGKKVIWDGSKWAEKPSVQIWDGVQWMFKYPDPVYYPTWHDSNGGIKDGEYRTFKLPKDLRLGDFVVTLCVSRDSMPQLLNPAGNLTGTKQLASGTWVSCVMFRYDGEWNLRNGDAVRWRVPGGGESSIANYVYRGAETRDIPITPFYEVKEYANVSEVPLNSPAGNTTLYLALTEAKNLTNVQFPEGVTSHRPPIQGVFGEFQLLIHSGDMPGTGSEGFGKVLFDTTVPAASVITVKIPGDPKSQPVWVLGDQMASILGKTTILQ
ncbi:hypothetical protein AB0O76_40590 [Streptomyces sp. NPDC086554]|uniref:hypothetical protein n=1 Tax=Streptomyces sp. NPDC086554 TaxID=3154864 RepID=UPI00342EDF9D